MAELQHDHSTKSEEVLPSPPTNDNPLSEREMEVARLLAKGLSNSEIARQLIISPHTVKVHLRNIFEKLAVSSRTEASMVLLQHGWLTVTGVEVVQPTELEAANATPSPLPTLPPEPEPLVDLPAQFLPWQRFYLIGASIFCLLLLIVPNLRTGVSASSNLLSDAGRTAVGRPALQLYPRWDVRTPLTTPRSRLALARFGEQLYVIGGEGISGEALTTVEAYDLRVNEWRSRQPLPEPLTNAAAVALNKRVYVAGGSTNPPDAGAGKLIRDLFLAYNADGNEWQLLEPLPNPLAGAQLVTDDQALYLIGGWDGQNMHNEVWRYTPSTTEDTRPVWELITRLETPCAFMGATIVDNEIYVVGGYDGQRELTSATVYSIASGKWRSLPDLATARGGLSLVYDGLAFFALGGGWTRAIDTHERFDPTIQVWSNFPSPLPGEWRNLAAATFNDRVYILGGWSGDYLDVHLQYQSTFRALLPVISGD
jgi:DNA-binding CsgD family transcriptional regulator/N-acetylneuraminic acid mutarotase